MIGWLLKKINPTSAIAPKEGIKNFQAELTREDANNFQTTTRKEVISNFQVTTPEKSIDVQVTQEVKIPPELLQVRELLKKATERKDAKDFKGAIKLFKEACEESQKHNITHELAVHLRLPMYLQKAGMPEEAWKKYNLLLNNGYPGQNSSWKDSDEAKIYDKMRLFLEREKRYAEAAKYEIFSYLSDIRDKFLKKENHEAYIVTSKTMKNLKDKISIEKWKALNSRKGENISRASLGYIFESRNFSEDEIILVKEHLGKDDFFEKQYKFLTKKGTYKNNIKTMLDGEKREVISQVIAIFEASIEAMPNIDLEEIGEQIDSVLQKK